MPVANGNKRKPNHRLGPSKEKKKTIGGRKLLVSGERKRQAGKI